MSPFIKGGTDSCVQVSCWVWAFLALCTWTRGQAWDHPGRVRWRTGWAEDPSNWSRVWWAISMLSKPPLLLGLCEPSSCQERGAQLRDSATGGPKGPLLPWESKVWERNRKSNIQRWDAPNWRRKIKDRSARLVVRKQEFWIGRK